MPVGLAPAATITVTTVADENGTGPNCSLREAIASANGDADVGGCAGVGAYGADTIVFASTLSLPATITLTSPAGALTVSSDVTITGPGATQLAIDGNHTAQVFSISTGQVMMSDLTIQHGNSPDSAGGIINFGMLTVTNSTFLGNSGVYGGVGGGILNEGGTLTVTNSSFSGNSAPGGGIAGGGNGGGIYNNAGTLIVTTSTFSANSAGTVGAGIANKSGGTLIVTNSTFTDNRATSGGGGILNEGGTLIVTNSTFTDNSASGGGGISNNAGTLTVTNSTFSGNSASYGGGIDNYGGTPTVTNSTVTNSTFSGNSARNSAGGGILNEGGEGSTLTVTNSTFSGNSSGYLGGGISNGGYGTLTVTDSTFSGNSGGGVYREGGTVTLTNTIVANSTSGGNCSGTIIDGGHNIDDGTTCSFTGTGCTATSGSSFCNTDPQLDRAGLANNGGPTQTIALCGGIGIPNASCTNSTASPAINAGNESVCNNPPVNGVDQRGFGRPGTGHTQCSIGAYEADAVSLEPCVGDCDGTGSVTIDELITLVNIALGTAQASACPHGVPSGTYVDVALIIQAVDVALSGCAA